MGVVDRATTFMYRCYLLRDRRIVKAENLDAATLEQALLIGRQLLIEQAFAGQSLSGIEIWLGASLLYSDLSDDTRGSEKDDASGRDDAAVFLVVPGQSVTAVQG